MTEIHIKDQHVTIFIFIHYLFLMNQIKKKKKTKKKGFISMLFSLNSTEFLQVQFVYANKRLVCSSIIETNMVTDSIFINTNKDKILFCSRNPKLNITLNKFLEKKHSE